MVWVSSRQQNASDCRLCAALTVASHVPQMRSYNLMPPPPPPWSAGGSTWLLVLAESTNFQRVAVSADGGTVAVVSKGGIVQTVTTSPKIYVSGYWSTVSLGVPGYVSINSIAITGNGSKIVVSANPSGKFVGGVYYSTDRGRTFSDDAACLDASVYDVCSLGAGGSDFFGFTKLAMSRDGAYYIATLANSALSLHSNIAYPPGVYTAKSSESFRWTLRFSFSNSVYFTGLAASIDGRHLVAPGGFSSFSQPGEIWTSDDFGLTWAPAARCVWPLTSDGRMIGALGVLS